MIEDLAKIVWRWHFLLPQIAEDFRYHRRAPKLDTPFLRRFAEQQRLLWSNRVRAVDYYSYGLFEPTMPAASKRKYIGGFQRWRFMFAFNPKASNRLMDEKLEFNAYAAQASLATPETLAVVTKQRMTYGFPVVTTEPELAVWVEQNAIEDVIIKPVDGTKGWGILSLGRRVNGMARWKKLPGDETIDLAAVWAHCVRYLHRGGVMIQRRLQPHPILANLMPDVLHTVRIITYLNPEPVIIDAVLRVGSGKGPADNLAQGGIVVHVEPTSGRCEQGVMLVGGLPQAVDEHPITGRRINGVVLPDWSQACDLAKAAARAFSMQKSIGWDVGLTTQGPILLEGNWCYDLAVNQIAGRKGILATSWVDAFNREGAYKHLGLGFVNRPR